MVACLVLLKGCPVDKCLITQVAFVRPLLFQLLEFFLRFPCSHMYVWIGLPCDINNGLAAALLDPLYQVSFIVIELVWRILLTVSMTSGVTAGLSLLSLTYFTIPALVFGKFILPSKTPFTMSLAVTVLFGWCSPARCWLSPSRSSEVFLQTLQTNLVVRPPLATETSSTSATSCFSGVIRGLFSLGRSKFIEELPQTCRLQPCAFTCVSLSLSSCLSWHSCHAVFSCLDLPCKTKNSSICNKIIFKFPAGFAGSRAHVNRHSSSRLLCERSLRTSSDISQVLPCLVPFSHAVIRSNDFHAVLWLKKIIRQADFRIAWAFGLLAGCSGLFLIL
jgi:hypothetical protein